MIEWAAETSAQTIALDVPSGIDSTTGETPGQHVNAAVTMTLALPKTGLDAASVGDLWLADIGIPQEVYRRVGLEVSADVFGAEYRVLLSQGCDPPATVPAFASRLTFLSSHPELRG